MPRLEPAIRLLLIANLAVFGLQWWMPSLIDQLALWPLASNFQPWQLVTYAFLHGGFAHIAFNMIGLVTFGNELEQYWGTRRLLTFYFASVLAAGLTQLTVTASIGEIAPTVGASGGIYGLLLGFAMMFPHRKVVPLIPPIPMPAWLFAVLFAGLELYLGVTGTAAGIAHFAHLGGMIGGWIMIQRWRRRATPRY
ncbi:MAG: rhomboid family intramembrane serine protease [Gammaproteobacteria bacterium]|jgi:membrane associated rhomboid family serine protease|nr:rhomboid family intramembrane serine protease [Gammaproteobacteria bacterium]